MDIRVLAVALGGALLTGVLATSVPAVLMLGSGNLGIGRAGERSSTPRGASMRGVFTVMQIGASLTLLVGALLLVRTVRGLDKVELGVEPDGVTAFGYSLMPRDYDAEAAREFRRRLLERMALLPGVESAAMAYIMPLVSGSAMTTQIGVPGRGTEPVRARRFDISGGYFETMGTRVLAGEGFGPSGTVEMPGEQAGVVLSEGAARMMFGDTNVVGRSVEVRLLTGVAQRVVVGVVEDVRGFGPRNEPMPAVYLPLSAAPASMATLGHVLIRSRLGSDRVAAMARGALADLDPTLPFFHAEPLSESVREWTAEERLLARLLGLFAVLAATLAGTGLYAVVGYSVAERRREIGIRVALGASRAGVAGLIARQSLALTAGGIVLGVAGGYTVSRVLASRLFDVTPLDAVSYGLAAVGLMVVALVASVAPARAAAAVDPAATLKAG